MFLDFAKIDGQDLNNKCNTFADKANRTLLGARRLSTVSFLFDRTNEEKRISAGTIKNRKVVVKKLLEIIKIPFE
jgi:hypothetical protein